MPIEFDFEGARKSGATDKDISGYFKEKYSIDFDIEGAKKNGANDADILDYLNTKYSEPVKKKEPTIGLGYEKPSEALRMGGLPKQEKLSQSPLKTAATTTQSVSIKRPSLEFTTEKPASTFAVDNKDLALTVGSREDRKKYLGEVRENILGVIEKYPDLYVSQKDKPTFYGERKIPAGTPNVDNISKAIDEYAEKIKRDTGKELSTYDKQYVVKSVVESLASKKAVSQAAALVDLDLIKEKKLPLFAVTGVKSLEGKVVKESVFKEELQKAEIETKKEQDNLPKQISTKLDTEFAPELNKFKEEIKGEADLLNNEIQNQYKQLFESNVVQLKQQYQTLVNTGQMPVEQANAEFQQKQQEISSQIQEDLNMKFKPEFDAINNRATIKTKEIQTKYNRKYKAEFDRIQQRHNEKIKSIQSKYEGVLDKKYFEEYSSRLGKKIAQVSAQNAQKELADFRNLPTSEKLQKALAAGWSDVLSSVGGAIGYTGLDATEINNAAMQTGLFNPLPAAAFQDKSLKDMLTDTDWWITNGVRALPFTAVTMPISFGGGAATGALARALGATKRAQVLSSVIGGGYIGWEAERFLESGNSFKEAIDEGKSVSEAAQIAATSSTLQFATLPLNIAQMLPFFGKGFKFLNSVALEGVTGGLEEIIQGWSGQRAKNLQEGTEQNGFGEAVNSFGDYFLSKQAMQEGAIGFAIGQTMAVASSLNSTPDIDKQIHTIMSSLGVGGETQARKALQLMMDNGAISETEFAEYNNLIDYTLDGIASVEQIPVSDDIKSVLVNKYVGISKARALMTEDENDLASQAAKELIAEKEKEIKEILKGNQPVYLVFPKGTDIPIVTTKEQVEQILKKNPKAFESFDITSMNDQVTQAKIDEAKDTLNKKQQAEETTTDGEGTIEGAISTGTDVAEEGLGMATEPSGEGITGEGVQAQEVLEKPTQDQILSDLQNGNIVTFEYKSKNEIPDALKDKVSSVSTINGVTTYKVTIAKSEADFLLQDNKQTPQTETVPQAPLTAEEIETRRQETEDKIKRKDLFIGVGEFSTELGGSDLAAVPFSHKEKNGIEFVEYAHPKTGSVDVIVTGKSDNDFVGFYRIYENGKPTNKWSSKFENQSRNKEDFKTMISGVQEMLPAGHEYTEKTSISTDGLRVWNQQLERGYELQYDENGKLITNSVFINGDAIVNELGIPVDKGNFDRIRVTTREDFEKVKAKLLPYLEKFGLDESSIKWISGNVEITPQNEKAFASTASVKIDLPVLKSTDKTKQAPQAPVEEVTAPAIEVTPTAEAAKPEVEGKKGFEDLAKKNKLNFRTAQNLINKYVRPFTEADYASATQEDIDLATANRDAGKEREGYKEEKAKKATKAETKKTKPEEIGEGLLDILGIAPVEPAAPAKKAGKTKPVNVSNKSELAELEDQADGDKKTIIEAAKKGIATLKSIFPDMEIYIHEDPDSYNETMSEVGGVANSRGNFAFERDANDNPTGRGRIDINLSNAKDTTVAHELVHAVLLKEFGDNPAVFKAFRDRMSKILRADLNEQVTAFEKLYSGQDVAPEEYLTELAALLSQGGETVEYKPSTLRRVAALINEFVSKITKGKFQPFRSEVDFINFVGFLNQISGAISEGGVIDDTDVLNGGGEVGTFNFTSKGQLKAPKASEDSRDFIRNLVEDVDIREFNGKKFVTNMYDYTTAGVADLGNGFTIDMLGGKNYVPLMMSKKNKAIGDVSNLAAFNTKGQAESFVRNAKKGKAELFAPHSGTLSASWQFQQHTFAELVNVLLDKGIMNNAELINTFNKTIQSSQANQKAFEAFKNKYKENIQNFDSFKSNPKQIVKLLDIENNYSPDLRKALNNAISADKTFQKAIGIKNKEEFFNKIIDPLNKGVVGGELINVVKFDPNTFEIVQTKPDAIDHHPSFGWTLLAKINGIYQPTEFHKSSEVTNSYTKYNKSGASVSRKATEPSYEKTNVSSSAGAIPKIAKLEVEKTGGIKSKAQVDVYHGSPYDFDKFTTEKIGTGEGAQAFGWGLYFTDIKSIAQHYAEKLGGSGLYVNGIEINRKADFEKYTAANDIAKLGYERALERQLELKRDNFYDKNTSEKIIENIKTFKNSTVQYKNKGVQYKVSLHEGKSPSEYTWLEWDKKPNKEQVSKLLSKLNQEQLDKGFYYGLSPDETNGSFYKKLTKALGSDKAASLFLLGNGIDGIKYPAESISAGATSDTARGFNYVVFDENAVTIKSKSQKAQNDKIKEFIENQRKAGQSDKDIRAGLELVADKVGLTKEDINDLMSKEVEPAKVTEPKKKLRRMAERIMFQGKEVPDSIAYYTPTTIEAADAKAKELLDELGIDDLVKLISENPEWISIEFFPRVARAAILEINKEQDDIQSKLKKADDKNLSKRLETLSDMKMMVYGKALPISSRAGLSLSMWKDFSEGIPFDHVREVQRIFELSNEKTKNTFIDVLNKLNLINDNVIEQVAAKVANTVGKSKVEKAKANYESSKRSLKDIWNRSRNVGVAETPWERARKNLQFDKALAKAAKDFIIYKSVQFSQFIKEVSDMLGIAESDIDKNHLKGIFDKVKETQIQKGIKGALSDMDMSLKDLIVDHYTELQETEKSLVDKLKESFGLEEADAQEVANEVSKEIRKLSIKEKVKAIKASGLSQGKWVDELLTLSDSGSLEFKDIRDEFAKKIGIRELTDEQMKKLEGLATEMRDQKDPRKKASLAQDLEDYKQVLKTTYGLEDFLVADYLSNLFASVGSNLVNFLGNFQESLGLLNELFFTSIAKGNFKDLSKSFNQFASGTSRGAGFAKQVIMEGKTTYKPIGELKPRQVFEIIMSKPAEDLGVFEKFVQSAMRKKILGKVISFNYKFWNRLLLSMDALSGVTNTELGALEKAVKAANKLGLKGQERSEFLNRELGLTIGVIKNALKTAKELGYEKGSKEYNRLVKDLIIEGRSEETKEYSKKYSMRATLTQEPPSSTLVGAVASGINSIAKKYKATKFIFPVVNTFANLIIKSIERSPFEFISLGADAMRVKTGNLSKEALSDDEIKRRLKAATIFTMAGVALFLMAGGADDEERDFDIFGSGTGDKDLNALLKTKGWKPYSIKFSKNSGYWSFEYTPIGFLLGFVGDLRDLARYKSEEHARLKQMISKKMYKKNYDELDENEKLEVFNEAMSGEYKLDDNYLTMILKLALTPVKLTGELIKSVGAITKIMSGDAEEGIKYLASTGRGVLSPRYGGEIKDIFDNKLYDTKIAWTVLTSNIPFVEVGDVKVDGFGRDITKYDREEGAAGLLQGLKYMVTRRIYNPSRGNEIDFFLAKNMIKILPPTNDLFYTDEKYKEYMALRGIIALEKIKDEMDKGTFDELSPMSIRNEINEILGEANKKAKKEINKTVFRNIK